MLDRSYIVRMEANGGHTRMVKMLVFSELAEGARTVGPPRLHSKENCKSPLKSRWQLAEVSYRRSPLEPAVTLILSNLFSFLNLLWGYFFMYPLSRSFILLNNLLSLNFSWVQKNCMFENFKLFRRVQTGTFSFHFGQNNNNINNKKDWSIFTTQINCFAFKVYQNSLSATFF